MRQKIEDIGVNLLSIFTWGLLTTLPQYVILNTVLGIKEVTGWSLVLCFSMTVLSYTTIIYLGDNVL